jgi:myo-inositol-1(or 4)-monophosphatase
VRLNDDLDLRRRVAEEAARGAGAVHLRHRGEDLVRDMHGDHTDYSTKVDLEAQEAVKQVIARHFPHEPVIGEEDVERPDELPSLAEDGCWFVDPLDGTLEYAHGSPAYSAIVSFVRHGEPLACAIYFPEWQEMFSAALDLGATLNARPVHVSGVHELKRAILSIAYRGAQPERVSALTTGLAKIVPEVEAIRLPGAPGLSACYVACGRFDIFRSIGQMLPAQEAPRPLLNPWETAAFVLLVREAGGAVAAPDGGAARVLSPNVYAASKELLDEYFRLMAGA